MHSKKKKRRQETLNHINRIQGQIEGLKRAMDHEDCLKVATLTTAIAKSFDTLRFRTLEGYLLHQFNDGKEISPDKQAQLNNLLRLYKK